MSTLPRGLLAVVVALVVSSSATSGAAPVATFRSLGKIGEVSVAYGVSADGTTVVGEGDFFGGVPTAFRWTAATGAQPLDGTSTPLNFGESRAVAASADGSVAVGFFADGNDSRRTTATYWKSGADPRYIDDIANRLTHSELNTVSADGALAAGAMGDDTRRVPATWSPADGWKPLTATPGVAYGISADGSVVVGESGIRLGELPGKAFRYTTQNGLVELGVANAGDQHSVAAAVSADGTTVVGSSGVGLGNPGEDHAFRWRDGKFQTLDSSADSSTYALGVSADGSTIIGNRESFGEIRPFIWTEATGIQEFGAFLAEKYQLEPAVLEQIFAITPDGRTIVGRAETADEGSQAFIVTLGGSSAIPLPNPVAASVACFISACVWRGWRRVAVMR